MPQPVLSAGLRRALWVIPVGFSAPAFAVEPATAATHQQASSQPQSHHAQPAPSEIVVTGRRLSLLGTATTASEGRVGREDLDARPLLRSGDLLEFVPGLIATQHSGSGKANQYFLRGFNLDHGTDFATHVDGMPVNMRTHGHGQGWTDLNFLIPETVQDLSYSKGVYSAEAGDFSSVGSARFTLARTVPDSSAELSGGSFGYLRALVLHSQPLRSGNLLLAGEAQSFDGPWTDIKENVRKVNALLRYTAALAGGEGHVTLMGCDNSWRSPDQIPSRAVSAGIIGPLGSIDQTLGGKASRYSVSSGWSGSLLDGDFGATAYLIRSRLGLFSNFTYFLDDPVEGDQFRQVDKRTIAGVELRGGWNIGPSRLQVGAEGRFDDIGEVALYRSRQREHVGTIREDAVRQGSIGLHASYALPMGERLRSTIGLRYDAFRAQVDAKSLPANSGKSSAGRFSAKANLAYRVSDPLELYASYGRGFHSNDARGTTIRFDPLTGGEAERVPALVGTGGGELGMRWLPLSHVQASAVVWRLDLGSELLFVGDAGGTEASRPSRRQGVEIGLYLLDTGDLSGELEISYTRSRFRDQNNAGRHIPGSIPFVMSAGLKWEPREGWSISPRIRYVGRYPLIEDGSVAGSSSLLVNLRVAREWQRVNIGVELFNVLNRKDHDIDYFYPSRLDGEPPGGIDDVHYHVFQPRSARLTVRRKF